MGIRDLVLRTRSCRRFLEDNHIERDTLLELVDLGRLSGSAANRQPLRYILSNEPADNGKIFPCVSWAGYLKDWPGPQTGERPSAYIIILNDTRVAQSPGCDHGIAAQSILLGATERGLAGCMIGSIRRDELKQSLSIAAHYDVVLVIALGAPRERIVLDEVTPDGDIRYWREPDGTHHVPKRRLDDIVVR